ncbi:DMT family transporter [Roseovarius aestuariivivens]|uniref:DMT family transporter n=1 Tax=Roseovarius aestuariivivens TaxID=1888910 RepID=UPI001FD92DF8|nr:DMT family transporter [Roseovarius aestuariivivens]
MKHATIPGAVIGGVALTALYTLLISGADAITKQFAANYAPPQLFALSGGLVVLFCLLANRDRRGRSLGLHTTCPKAMAVRAVATVLGTIAFFYAFQLLPFADVFLFIALIPLMAALLSGPVLSERVRPQAWCALGVAVLGVGCLFQPGFGAFTMGHGMALLAVMLGTVSMVASRYIGQRDQGLLVQVFYPNLALMLTMALVLPFVYRPMPLTDLGWAVVYALLLFMARWVLVAALRALPAYVVTPLMNLQFVWMVLLGAIFFGEMPGAPVLIGALLVVSAGVWLVLDETSPRSTAAQVPAE